MSRIALNRPALSRLSLAMLQLRRVGADEGAPGPTPAAIEFYASTYDTTDYEALVIKTGTGPATTPHTSDILARNVDGYYDTYKDGEAVWQDGRFVRNRLSNSWDFNNTGGTNYWSQTYVSDTNLITLPAWVSFTGSDSLNSYDYSIDDEVNITADIEYISGNNILHLKPNGLNIAVEEDVTITSGRKKYSSTSVLTQAGTKGIRIENRGATEAVFRIHSVQLEAINGQINKNPGEYIETTTAPVTKVFQNSNANEVTANVVTEATGPALAVQPKQVAQDSFTNDQIQSNDQADVEWTATNVTPLQDETGLKGVADTACTLTATAANGTVIGNAITAASDTHAIAWYIKRKTGVGEVELTLDNGATWTARVLSNDFDLLTVDQAALTNPQIGIRIKTSGDAVIVGNAEAHLTKTAEEVDAKTGPIFTTTVLVSTTAVPPTYPAANHSDSKGPYVIQHLKTTGADQAIFSLGGTAFFKVASNLWTLTDGTNTVTEAHTPGDDDRIGIAFDATALTMAFRVNDGSWSTTITYDGSLGSGILTFGVPTAEVTRWDEDGGLAAQKTIAEGEMVNYLTGDSFDDILTDELGNGLTV